MCVAAVGFETTTPIYALLLDEIIKQKIENVQLLTALKTMPNVIATLCENDNKIDGFIAPGHVAVITGSNAFVPLAERYSLLSADLKRKKYLHQYMHLLNFANKVK